MFEINEVYEPIAPHELVTEPVRVLRTDMERVLLIAVAENTKAGVLRMDYDVWDSLVEAGDRLRLIADPFADVPAEGGHLPEGARKRLVDLNQVLTSFASSPEVMYSRSQLSEFLTKQAALLRPPRSADTVKRWFHNWLRSGSKPMAVVLKLLDDGNVKKQASGAKRGVKSALIPAASAQPGYMFEEQFSKAFQKYVRKGESYEDAYNSMLIHLLDIPEDDIKQLFTNPEIASKYRFPTPAQFRNAMLALKAKEKVPDGELPRGKRGKARDRAYGPGFYEIDATFFQIQLVSRVGGRNLVSRPIVYLIVDIYSGVIVGYAVSLENPSWAVAALALHNCFSDKGATFKRLKLPYVSEDWPCCHLPTVLRADRAELVSNRGQEFPTSMIRVEITPSGEPIAKGTVEGKNSELKRPKNGRFNLPGLFSKIRKRRDPDGKKDAALTLPAFEEIIVEIIMDLNRRRLRAKQVPQEAVAAGLQVGSRIQLWQWGLKYRSGHTVRPNPNFVYEHLMTRSAATLFPTGIQFRSEIFNCDRLKDLGYVQSAPAKGRPIPVAFNPLYAGEVYFLDGNTQTWVPAFNMDGEILAKKPSFAELKEFRSTQTGVVMQASLDASLVRTKRDAHVREVIKTHVNETAELRKLGGASTRDMRNARSADQRLDRGPGLNGAIPQPATDQSGAPQPSSSAAQPMPARRRAIDFWDDE